VLIRCGLCKITLASFALGVVNDTIDRRHTSVKFDSAALGCQTVAARYVLPRTGAVARPYLSVCIHSAVSHAGLETVYKSLAAVELLNSISRC